MATPDPKRKVVSQAELARYLGLSDWTVSRAINGHPAVKESTRQRVLAAMKEIGFQPDPFARGLSGKGSGLVGIIFGELRHRVLLQKLALFEKFLYKHGLRSLLAFVGVDEASEERAIADFKRLRVDAIVMIQTALCEEVCSRLLSGCRTLHIDTRGPRSGASVVLDRERGVEMLIDHLYELGHRSFGTLGILERNAGRWRSIAKALHRHGLTPEQHLREYASEDEALQSGVSYGMGIELAETVMADPHPPTALLAINDHVALAAAQHLIQHGYSVPGDFSITGFDHVEVSRFLRPRLTTIDHEPEQLMEAAGRLLLRQFKEELVDERVEVIPSLVIGESTGPVSAGK